MMSANSRWSQVHAEEQLTCAVPVMSYRRAERSNRPSSRATPRPSSPGEFHPEDRVARGGHPPPAPPERSVQFSRTTLVRKSFTAPRELVAPGTGDTALVAAMETAP